MSSSVTNHSPFLHNPIQTNDAAGECPEITFADAELQNCNDTTSVLTPLSRSDSSVNDQSPEGASPIDSPRAPKTTYCVRLLKYTQTAAIITLLAVCAMGIAGIVGGNVLGGTVIVAGSYLILKHKMSLPMKAAGLAVNNSIALLAITATISPAIAGACVLLPTLYGTYVAFKKA